MYDLTFTGKDCTFTRDEMTSMARRKGWNVRNSVTSKTNLVVADYFAAKEGTTKARKAQKNGVAIISFEQFKQMVR